jgi:hypothetical protein
MTKEEISATPQVRLDELQTILSIIGAPGQSERYFLSSLPSEKLAEVSIFAESIVYGCLPDHRLQIKVGREAINGYKPGSAVNIQREHHVPLEPGTILLIDKFTRIFDEVVGDMNHFFSGDKDKTFVSLGSVALNLLQDGEISIVRSTELGERFEFKR